MITASTIPGWAWIVFALQGILMGVDEFVLHRRRGLPNWERLGHPLDTLTVLSCAAITLVLPPNSNTILIFMVMAIISTVFITKDEWIHSKYCGKLEMQIHALLFVLHPILLFAIFEIWKQGSAARPFLFAYGITTFAFMGWQIFFWNFGFGRQIPVRSENHD